MGDRHATRNKLEEVVFSIEISEEGRHTMVHSTIGPLVLCV
jgi:hypothetical protein